jgi:hypothetical protein
MKRSLEHNSQDQAQFFQQVKSSKDGFSVIAEYFGKGITSKTSNGPMGAVRSGSTSSSCGLRVLLLVSLSQYYAKECQDFKNMLL